MWYAYTWQGESYGIAATAENEIPEILWGWWRNWHIHFYKLIEVKGNILKDFLF